MTDNVIGIDARRRPIGTFRAVSCRDGASLERNGQPYFELNHLDTADGRPLCEVVFEDGVWLLAEPTHDLIPGFVLDYDPKRVYLAHSYGPTWNGWATPVIERSVVQDLLDDLGEPHHWSGGAVWVGDDESPFTPRADGLYDTQYLGWTFRQVDP